jgi:hypothetical protein
LLVACGACATTTTAEPPFTTTINQAQSSVTATLTLVGGTATDSSPVNGTFRVGIDDIINPTSITIHGFTINVTDRLDLNLSIPFLASFTSNAQNVVLTYTGPTAGTGPVSVTAGTGAFAFPAVEATGAGTLTYNATGLYCAGLSGAGLACSGTFNIADQGEQTGAFSGTMSRVNRTVSLNAAIDVTSPLDPANPSLGSLRIQGTIRSSATVPCPSDFNGTGGTTVQDIFDFLSAWSAASPTANVNGDTAVSVQDIFDFLEFWSGGC